MSQPHYPLHHSVKDLIDPEYKLNIPPVHCQPVAASWVGGHVMPETFGSDIPVRVFIPPSVAPASGWPVFFWFHGGGWVLSNIGIENSLCTNLCVRAGCVVITTDCRLAPEHPFPAAVHDAWEAALWVSHSAGGNLAAVHTPFSPQKVSASSSSLPVTDNTATVESNALYKIYEQPRTLPVDKMLWYRRHYLPNEADWSNPEASPLLVSDPTIFSKLPPALEGQAYGQRLQQAGVEAEIKVIDGVPHPFMVMDAVLHKAHDTANLICNRIAEVFK
ncbi:Alpha/Beta hydrolase protein [Xylariales sp. PMI_506]|nr:Alpha/Beta hydrolase protein [Xylariales sp. PMI_506]